MPTPAQSPLTPEFRTWLEHERTWGRHALRSIARRRELLGDNPPMERFKIHMALVELTGSVARWSRGLAAGLEKVGRADAAAALASGPPFPSGDTTPGDFDRLGEFVEAGIALAGETLSDEAPEGGKP